MSGETQEMVEGSLAGIHLGCCLRTWPSFLKRSSSVPWVGFHMTLVQKALQAVVDLSSCLTQNPDLLDYHLHCYWHTSGRWRHQTFQLKLVWEGWVVDETMAFVALQKAAEGMSAVVVSVAVEPSKAFVEETEAKI